MNYDRTSRTSPYTLATNSLEDAMALVSTIDDRRKVASVQIYHGLRKPAYEELAAMRKDIAALREALTDCWCRVEALKL